MVKVLSKKGSLAKPVIGITRGNPAK